MWGVEVFFSSTVWALDLMISHISSWYETNRKWFNYIIEITSMSLPSLNGLSATSSSQSARWVCLNSESDSKGIYLNKYVWLVIFRFLQYHGNCISCIKQDFLTMIAVVVAVTSGENIINTSKTNLRTLTWLQIHYMEDFLMISKKLRPFPVVMHSPSLQKIKDYFN